MLRCSLPRHWHPGKVCPKGKGWEWDRGGADGAGLGGGSGCWVEEPKVRCRQGGERDGDSPSVVLKKGQIHPFLAD